MSCCGGHVARDGGRRCAGNRHRRRPLAESGRLADIPVIADIAGSLPRSQCRHCAAKTAAFDVQCQRSLLDSSAARHRCADSSASVSAHASGPYADETARWECLVSPQAATFLRPCQASAGPWRLSRSTRRWASKSEQVGGGGQFGLLQCEQHPADPAVAGVRPVVRRSARRDQGRGSGSSMLKEAPPLGAGS